MTWVQQSQHFWTESEQIEGNPAYESWHDDQTQVAQTNLYKEDVLDSISSLSKIQALEKYNRDLRREQLNNFVDLRQLEKAICAKNQKIKDLQN